MKKNRTRKQWYDYHQRKAINSVRGTVVENFSPKRNQLQQELEVAQKNVRINRIESSEAIEANQPNRINQIEPSKPSDPSVRPQTGNKSTNQQQNIKEEIFNKSLNIYF